MAVQDRTNQPFESVKHDEPHEHPEPVPHLRAPGASEPADDHGPAVAHPHVHSRGAGDVYDHHFLDGHDSATDPPAALKHHASGADNHSP